MLCPVGHVSLRYEVSLYRHNLSITVYLGAQPRLGKLSGVDLSIVIWFVVWIGIMSMLIRPLGVRRCVEQPRSL
jgi:hypothetical protein